MKFVELFHLNLAHKYYSDGVCRDFTIEPTPRTARLLAGYRCVLKSGPGWLRVFHDNKLPQPGKDDRFVFNLQLENPQFPLFTLTDMSKHKPAIEPLGKIVGTPRHSSLVLRPRLDPRREHFKWETGGNRITLEGKPLKRVSELKVEGAGDGTTAVYDEKDSAIQISGGSASAGDRVTVSFLAQHIRPWPDFAEVEVVIGHQPTRFTIEFEPRKAAWVYYLLTDLPTPKKFEIVGEEPADSDPKLKFPDPEANPQDPILAGLTPLPGKMQCFRFVSEADVPCRQFSGRKLKLSADGVELANPLPNPVAAQITSLSAPSGTAGADRDAWYQIVRHLTR
jgi:hypothetical protein